LFEPYITPLLKQPDNFSKQEVDLDPRYTAPLNSDQIVATHMKHNHLATIPKRPRQGNINIRQAGILQYREEEVLGTALETRETKIPPRRHLFKLHSCKRQLMPKILKQQHRST
jgi:hypothetical protein